MTLNRTWVPATDLSMTELRGLVVLDLEFLSLPVDNKSSSLASDLTTATSASTFRVIIRTRHILSCIDGGGAPELLGFEMAGAW